MTKANPVRNSKTNKVPRKWGISNGANQPGLPGYDNMWCTKPQKTIDPLGGVRKPWIAYKVLAAGAIHPREGLKHAFENGADFACVGMFDFQISENVIIAKDTLNGKLHRKRPFRA